MRLRFCINILTFFLLSFATVMAQAGQYSSEKIDARMAQWMKKNGIPGAAVEIYSNGEKKSFYYGYADKEKKIPITENTIFEIASITKIFTTVLLADAIKTGTMKLSDPVSQYVQDIPSSPLNQLNKITLGNLATHTSGFPFNVPRSINSRKKLSRFIAKWKNPSTIGTKWLYSNVNMGLLGFSLEQQTQKSIYELYDEKILKPLGMHSSGAMITPDLEKYYAQGYNMGGAPAPRRNKKEWISPPNSDWIFPATGSLKASANDMSIFLRAALRMPGTPLALAEAFKLTQTTFVETTRFDQGLAWVIHPDPIKNKAKLLSATIKAGPYPAKFNSPGPQFDGNALMEKTGASGGFRSYIAIIPNERTGVVLLVNRYITSTELIRMGRELVLNQ